jgi:splicing factor 3B subunit 3
MHLYNLTLQPPTAATQAIVGNFSGARQQEIIVAHGTRLELLRPDVQTGKVSTVVTTDVFGSIRSLATFRLTGGTKGMCARHASSRMLTDAPRRGQTMRLWAQTRAGS